MIIDSTVSLGTALHALVMLGAIVGFYYKLREQVTRLEDKHHLQHQALVSDLNDIKNRLGCTEEEVSGQRERTGTISERLATLENDVRWLKQNNPQGPQKPL